MTIKLDGETPDLSTENTRNRPDFKLYEVKLGAKEKKFCGKKG
jgi:hypothetical protein